MSAHSDIHAPLGVPPARPAASRSVPRSLKAAWALLLALVSPVVGLIVAAKAYDSIFIGEDGSGGVLIHPSLFPIGHAIGLVGAAAAVLMGSLALHDISRSQGEMKGSVMAGMAIFLAILLFLVSDPWQWSAWWFHGGR